VIEDLGVVVVVVVRACATSNCHAMVYLFMVFGFV
jgi:hypothetical protein